MVIPLDGRGPREALAEAEANETIVADGRHEVEEPIAVTVPGVTLCGLDVRLADGADVNPVEIAADGVTLAGFRIDGNRANQPGDRRSNGVVVAGASNVTVANGHVREVSRHGLLVVDTGEVTSGGSIEGETATEAGDSETADVTVRDVRVDAPRRDGCSVEGPAVSNVTVENVRTFGSSDRGGVEVKDGARDALVANCHAEDCRYGVTIQDHGGYGVSNVRFVGNTAVRCDAAVDAQNAKRHENVVVLGNTGRDLAGDGMGGPGGIHVDRVDGLVVADNLLSGVDDAGIAVRRCTGATVTGNVVGDVRGAGVDVADSAGVQVCDNAAPSVRCRGGEGATRDLQVCDNRCPEGIRLDGRVERYLVATNLGAVEDDADGEGVVADNLA